MTSSASRFFGCRLRTNRKVLVVAQARKTHQLRSTGSRIGPTLDCKGCCGESQHHNKECRDRFNAKYGHKEPEIAPSPEPALTLELATPSGQPGQSSSSSSSMPAPPASGPSQEGQQEVQIVFSKNLIGLAFCNLHLRATKTLTLLLKARVEKRFQA